VIRSFFVFLAVLVELGAAVRSEDLLEPSPWEVIVECQMVALPQKAALLLIPELREERRIEAAYGKVQEMIGRGEATLIASPIVRGMAGKRLSTETVEELCYPVGHQPPRLPAGDSRKQTPDSLKGWPVVGYTPSIFETMHGGVTLELSASVSKDGEWISGDVRLEHIRLVRFTKLDGGVLPSGERLSVDLPEFSRLGGNSYLLVHAGQRLLLGLHKAPAEEKTMELFFLRLRTQKTGGTP